MTLRKKKNKHLFVVEDPEGRKISLRKDVWEKHISTKHPEAKVTKDNIKHTIENPNVIAEQEFYTNTYSYSNNSITKSKLYVNVLVSFTDEKRTKGDIRTSYVSSRLPKGKTIWISKKFSA